MLKNRFVKILYGLLFCFVLAVPAYFLGKSVRLVGGPVFAIVIGIIVSMLYKRPEILEPGIKFSSKKVLQYSIILIGFDLNMGAVLAAGKQSLVVLAFTFASVLAVAFFVGKYLLRTDRNSTILIGVGTAICGGSAIAAAAPAIGADEEEVAKAISTIFLFNIIAVFVFPWAGHLLGLGDNSFGMWVGTAINDTSSVVAAGYAWNNAAGDYATIVKLTRTLAIVPVTLVLALLASKRAAASGQANGQDKSVRFSKVFPWFILGFIAASILCTLGVFPQAVTKWLAQAGKFLTIVAMAGIGLNTNLPKLLKSGARPILLGLCCSVTVACVSLLVQFALGIA